MNEVQTVNVVLMEKAMKIIQEMNKSSDLEYRKIMLEKVIAQLQKDNQKLIGEMQVKDIPLVAKFMESAFEAGVAVATALQSKEMKISEVQEMVETSPQYIG